MSLLSRLLDFAGRKFAEEYRGGKATSPFASPSMLGFDDAEAQIALGGGATEHPHCIAPAADFARDGLKSRFHGERN
jgi:hypothetical protein